MFCGASNQFSDLIKLGTATMISKANCYKETLPYLGTLCIQPVLGVEPEGLGVAPLSRGATARGQCNRAGSLGVQPLSRGPV